MILSFTFNNFSAVFPFGVFAQRDPEGHLTKRIINSLKNHIFDTWLNEPNTLT